VKAVAEAKEPLSVVPPLKAIAPEIGIACAVILSDAITTATIESVMSLLFIVSLLMFSLYSVSPTIQQAHQADDMPRGFWFDFLIHKWLIHNIVCISQSFLLRLMARNGGKKP
jgi:hypothetical protein